MRGSVIGFLFCTTTLSLVTPASSQESGNRAVSVQMGNPAGNARLPYMAEFKTTLTKTLGDGSTITNQTTEVVAVDSEGRRMTAKSIAPPSADQASVTSFTVVDPMAHTRITWTSPGREAMVSAVPIPAASQSSCGMATFSIGVMERPGKKTKAPKVKTTVEDLGTDRIQGVEARGRRTTTTTTLAGAKKKSVKQVSTFEEWRAMAPGLRGLLARIERRSAAGQDDKRTRQVQAGRTGPFDLSIAGRIRGRKPGSGKGLVPEHGRCGVTGAVAAICPFTLKSDGGRKRTTALRSGGD